MEIKDPSQAILAKYLSVRQAADMLDVSPARVYQLVKSGRLASKRFMSFILIDRRSVLTYSRPPLGRPPKTAP